MCVDLHSRLVVISRLSCCSSGSDELISGLVGDPVIIGAKVEIQFRLVVARGLCFGEAPELIVPGVRGYSLHLVTGKVSKSC
jgi:hypothetical protein